MYLEFKTSFIVMPEHCNYMYPMIFGGKFFSELDLAAASAVRRALYSSPTGCDSAVTHKANVTFHAAAESGDLIYLDATIVGGHHKSIVVKVNGSRETKNGLELLAEAEFVFVTRLDGKFHRHGLVLPATYIPTR